jgi:DNA-binding response OmpR family regulator
MNIIIVEDEEDILELLEYTLSSEGYKIFAFKDINGVKELLEDENIDLIIMDRNLPSIEGSLFIKKIRQEGYNQAVIYLSAKDSSENILEGFDRGGDDYITKPFNLDELKARVKAVLKRVKKEVDILKYRDIKFDISKSEVYIDNNLIDLTHLEKKLLLEFMKNKNKVLTREVLLDNVWENSFDTNIKSVNVAVNRLKDKIDPLKEKNYIKAIRGEGYMFC